VKSVFHDMDFEPGYFLYLLELGGAWGAFLLGLCDGCVFSDGRKYLSVAMCVRFWLFALLHMFAILFWFFPTMRYPMVWSGLWVWTDLALCTCIIHPDMNERKKFIACKRICI
jgi:hypothetical protein